MGRPSCCPTIPLPKRAPVWVALLGGIAFILIAADVVYHGRLQQLDMPIARWIAEHRRPLGLPVEMASFVTDLGATPVIAGVAVITAIWLAVFGKWRMLLWGAATMAGEPILNRVLKESFALPRPTLETSIYPLNHGYTFPSGHAMAACVAFGILAVMASELRPGIRMWAWGAYGVICAAVGVALVYVGVHYVTDVLAAYAISACWLGTMVAPRWRRCG